jgi:DNA-binding response OmpR family regulator
VQDQEVAVEASVLVVDDSAIMVETLNSLLSSHGFCVESCLDGETGWQRLRAGMTGDYPMPDLLLLDLNMPGLDGWTLLSRIRSEQRLARLPVIVITAETDSATRKRVLKAGANDYLSKPVVLSDLLSRVEVFSSHRQ